MRKRETLIINYCGVEFEVTGYYTEEETGTHDVPGSPADFDLMLVEIDGQDLTDLLDPAVLDDLEEISAKELHEQYLPF